jgi:putative membrane protein
MMGFPFMDSWVGSNWMFVGWIIGVLFWVLIFYGIFSIIKSFSSKNGGYEKNALEILKERYARGEIKKQEFEKMKKDLE